MQFSNFYLCFVWSVLLLMGAAVPTPEDDGGMHTLESDWTFNSSCWDTKNYDGPKATRSDILALASKIRGSRDCIMARPSDTLTKHNIANVSEKVYAHLLWTGSDINKGIRKVSFSCNKLATRIEQIANSCATLLGSEILGIWTLMNACDATILESTNPGNVYPSFGQSGAALNVFGGEPSKRPMIPDVREKRRWWPYVNIKVMEQEDESPVPGFESG